MKEKRTNGKCTDAERQSSAAGESNEASVASNQQIARLLQRTLASRRIDRDEQGLEEVCVSADHRREPCFGEQLLERWELDRVIATAELVNDRRFGAALFGEAEREIVQVTGPVPDLLGAVNPVVDDTGTVRVNVRITTLDGGVIADGDEEDAARLEETTAFNECRTDVIV